METLNTLYKYFFSGESPNNWLSAKIFMAFIGGLGSYLVQNEYFLRPGIKKLSFRDGVIFSLFSSIAGTAILGPSSAANAFGTGLVGVSAMTSFINHYNEGATDKKLIDKNLSQKDIEKLRDEEA